jgi:hypothetical protein
VELWEGDERLRVELADGVEQSRVSADARSERLEDAVGVGGSGRGHEEVGEQGGPPQQAQHDEQSEQRKTRGWEVVDPEVPDRTTPTGSRRPSGAVAAGR